MVLDASVVAEILQRSAAGVAIASRVFDSGETLHAPELLDVEVANVLRRWNRLGEVSEARSAEMLTDLVDFPIRRYPHRPFLPRIFELRHNLTAYDAAYIALAEALDATLVTRDKRLRGGQHEARVEVF